MPGWPDALVVRERTTHPFKNYVIRYSWTYPKDQPEKTTMNSGLLLHIQEPHQIWPKSVEPQGRYKDHGKLFFPGWSKDSKDLKESTFDEAAQKKAIKPSHEWNTTEATVRADGSIDVRINGVAVAAGEKNVVALDRVHHVSRREIPSLHLTRIQIKQDRPQFSADPGVFVSWVAQRRHGYETQGRHALLLFDRDRF